MASSQNKESTRLSVRNYATIGIFSVLMIILAIAVAIPAMSVLYFSLFISSPLIAFLSAPLFTFMVLKVHKRGTVLIYCLIMAILYLISGTPYLAAWFLLSALLGELAMTGRDAYKKFARITISWIICSLFRATNGMIDIWFFSKQYLASGVSKAHFNQVVHFYYSAPWILLILLLTAIGASLGGLVSTKLMKKHFVKSELLR
ncbi:MptD family putative ECF transporter S component [Sporolactobacillus shoreicorticis]|uniref:MptD family putative ECF transporter S component n=1 Tax=Sporolactobacillus shoreicorticis TaxID=1923877 RepID=A0ABW5S2F1_9BACL|nr:MptD family putative ECF transporter S component [Sporolactobacillus shoreicorticis]MCO7127054.1 MptD family putative ECF transporter S component [Sporolactobacillus shoreicorticis]